MNLQEYYHPKYGKIIEILKTFDGGSILKAKFENGKIHKFTLSQLKRKEKDYENKLNKSENNYFLIRKLIESLRYGIVIDELIEKITVNRKKEVDQILEWLISDVPILFLIGSYGSGKTHFLKFITNSLLLEKNWAVSFLTLDEEAIAFHQPKKFYQEVINNLYFVFNGKKYNFDFLFETLLEDNSYQDNYFLKHLKKNRENFELKEWIKGNLDIEDLPKLWSHQTAGNIYSYLLTSLSKVLKEKFSLNGLIIIVDESENFKSSWLNSYQSRTEMNFLKGFYLAILNEKTLLEEENKSYVDREERFHIGKKTNLIYNGFIKIPYLYKESFIKCIFALTGSLTQKLSEGSTLGIKIYRDFKRMSGYMQLRNIIKNYKELGLSEIDIEFYKKIIKKISKLYIQAYSLKLTLNQYRSILKIIKKNLKEFKEEVISTELRTQIQRFIYDLDILHNNNFHLREDI